MSAAASAISPRGVLASLGAKPRRQAPTRDGSAHPDATGNPNCGRISERSLIGRGDMTDVAGSLPRMLTARAILRIATSCSLAAATNGFASVRHSCNK